MHLTKMKEEKGSYLSLAWTAGCVSAFLNETSCKDLSTDVCPREEREHLCPYREIKWYKDATHPKKGILTLDSNFYPASKGKNIRET